MEYKLELVAERIKCMREILDLTYEDMAKVCEISVQDYICAENGKTDFSFTFLYKCAEKFGIDMMELATGQNPRLSHHSVVRAGQGLSVKRRSGLVYNHLAYLFKDKIAEPFLVKALYKEEEQNQEIKLSTHEGQEMDYILSGQMKFVIDGKVEILNAGDCVYYNSSKGHGMIATGGEECVFLAIVMQK